MNGEYTKEYQKIIKSRLFCLLTNSSSDLFFSLEDYRNNYFNSDNPHKIIEFYNSFDNREQLIQWMKERPKGIANIFEIEGNKEIIVVIPTADFNGKYAKECRENIFSGLHIVFVESGGRGDFYFNFAHNTNVGIRRALEYNPKWILFSGDDMYKIDDASVLIERLKNLDPERFSMVFTNETNYHSIPSQFCKARFTRFFILILIGVIGNFNWVDHFKITIGKLKTERRFQCKYHTIASRKFRYSMYKHGFNFISFTAFGIFSASYIKSLSGNLYDENFVNSNEDHDIAIKFFLEKSSYTFIDYKIGDYVGSSLGNGINRELRTFAGLAYLNYKVQQMKQSHIFHDH